MSDEALVNLQKAVELKPDYFQAYIQLTSLFIKLGRSNEAHINIKTAEKYTPLKIEYLNNLAILYIALEKYSDAEAKLRDAIRINSQCYEAYNNLAVVFEKVSDFENAELSYKQSIQINPYFPHSYFSLARLLIKRNRKTEAIQYLRDICEKRPESYEALYELGTVLLNFDCFDEAALYLEKAKNLKPTSSDVFRLLGDLNVKKNRLHKSCVYYREALRLNPVSVEAYCNLGAVLNELKFYPEAEEKLRKSLNLDSRSPRTYFNLSLTFANQNRFDEATELATKGIEISVRRKDKELLIEHLLDLCQKKNARTLFDQQLKIYSEELWTVPDSEFDRLYTEGLFRTGTMFSPSRRRNRFRFLLQKFQDVLSIDGGVAECGCFKGLSSFLLCSTMKKFDANFNGNGYQIFDSFEGLSVPETVDQKREYDDDHAPPQAIISSGHFAASVESVKHALDQFPKIEYFKGWIPEAFPANSIKKYKFVHVDVDLYQPTFDSFSYFWPLINKGGIMLCDDFNWSGASKAVEDFSLSNNIKFEVSEFNQAYFKKL